MMRKFLVICVLCVGALGLNGCFFGNQCQCDYDCGYGEQCSVTGYCYEPYYESRSSYGDCYDGCCSDYDCGDYEYCGGDGYCYPDDYYDDGYGYGDDGDYYDDDGYYDRTGSPCYYDSECGWGGYCDDWGYCV